MHWSTLSLCQDEQLALDLFLLFCWEPYLIVLRDFPVLCAQGSGRCCGTAWNQPSLSLWTGYHWGNEQLLVHSACDEKISTSDASRATVTVTWCIPRGAEGRVFRRAQEN